MPAKPKSRRVPTRQVPRKSKRPAARQAQNGVSDESRFLAENAKVLEAYAGEILLIRGRELLAHSKNYEEIEKVIQAKGIVSPFLFRVPLAQEVNFV